MDATTIAFWSRIRQTRSESLINSKAGITLFELKESIYEPAFMLGYNTAIKDIIEGKYPEIIMVVE